MAQYLTPMNIIFYLTCFVLGITGQLNNNNNNLNEPNFDLQNADALYKAFIRRYHRKFKDENDYYDRYLNFVETLRAINKINSKATVKVGPNQFADWTDEERHKRMEKLKKQVAMDPDLKAIENAKSQGPQVELVFPGSDTYAKYMKGLKREPKVSSHHGPGRLLK